MALIKPTCDLLEGKTWQSVFMSAFLWDDVNECFVLNVDADAGPVGSGATAGATSFTGALQTFASGTIRSITFVIQTGSVVFDGVTFPVGTFDFNEPNGGFIDNEMQIDTTGATGFFMTFT